MKFTSNRLQRNIVITTIITLIVVMSLFLSKILIMNLTESLPLGLWHRTSLDFHKGSVVGFCPTLPEKLKHDYRLEASKNGLMRICDENVQMLMKPIVAVPGDTVKVNDNKIFVNEIFIADRLAKDGFGNPIHSIKDGNYIVAEGEYWMISTYNRASFDSRYYGPIKNSQVKYAFEPLLVDKSKKFCWESQHEKCL
ncbi:signal peptidase I [Acinetobacter soli]|uniref:signal peptidase I n=1 Tax=Acinetobacter soli TaxID=487316 RepID=UPI00125E1B98|nr:signal peptidase I [Acinetobacter soli]